MPKGRKNLYTCDICRGEVVTLDLDEGTTPFMLSCLATPKCQGLMQSSFYQCDPLRPHQYEWVKADHLEEYDPNMQEHIRKGGLVLRRREVALENIPGAALPRAIEESRKQPYISAVRIQRTLKVSFPVASFLIRQMQERGVLFSTKGATGTYTVVPAVDWRRKDITRQEVFDTPEDYFAEDSQL
jgi:hypothetical protein